MRKKSQTRLTWKLNHKLKKRGDKMRKNRLISPFFKQLPTQTPIHNIFNITQNSFQFQWLLYNFFHTLYLD